MQDSNDLNIGVLGIEVYFPSTFVKQEDLEAANGVSKGKYTIGLGQEAMAFTGDHEDINSIALTVVHSLLEKYNIQPSQVGRLEIGTETLIDKSKSTKTVLMSLFEGFTDIEGATVINACYGGTAALLNALAWVESSCWDGRYAIVVAGDIAVYADGPARPTGGCGSVAMLVGRNAPLKIDMKTRTTFANHCWDFFKPNMDSEYPEVNGALSQTCYLQALDDCYTRFITKNQKFNNQSVSIGDLDYLLFHSPYNKLVQKSFGRLLYNDMLLGTLDSTPISKFLGVPREKTYEDKELETALKGLSASGYQSKVDISCKLGKQIGNTYTASVYMNLANLVSTLGTSLLNKKVILFSYGSGALASMFSVISRETGHSVFNLENIQKQLNVAQRLSEREKLSPEDLKAALKAREDSHGFIPFKPKFGVGKLFPGTYHLSEINTNYERMYVRKPLNETQEKGGSLFAETMVSAQQDEDSIIDEDDVGVDLDKMGIAPSFSSVNNISQKALLPRNETRIFASGRRNVKVVVTGISAAVPGRNNEVFPTDGSNNITKIIEGKSFITPIPDNVKDAMLEKHLFELVKNADGSMSKLPIDSYEKGINVSASLGKFSLTQYGVAESIVSTMDRAVQVAIACGLEALKDAQIVTGAGEGTTGWVLPEHLQASTGVVYATSFPALDTTIEEVSKYFKEKTIDGLELNKIVPLLRKRLINQLAHYQGNANSDALSKDTEEALLKLQEVLSEVANASGNVVNKPYEFDRKFLFRVLVLGNAQLAQIVKAKGPNMQTNAACAGKTFYFFQ
jgi:hydroxymethylglutaryl-CoA synthase